MTNLAQKHEISQGEVIEFPKQERQAMSDKDEGFTPMPNFICDEGYLAALGGEAVKCLVLLNRHVKGFHANSKSIGEALVMKITGIKDKRTVRKYMAELEKFRLIKIEKSLGKSHSYSLTFGERLQPKPVTHDVPSTSNVGTRHATTPVTHDVPTTSDMACHSVKEIYLNKTLNKTHTENTPEKNDFVEQWNPDLDHLKNILVQTKFSQRADEILSMADFQFHLGNFNAHWENKTYLTENQKTRKFASWLIQEFEKAERSVKAKVQASGKQSRNVNDAWDSIPQFQGEVDPVVIPEDFV